MILYISKSTCLPSFPLQVSTLSHPTRPITGPTTTFATLTADVQTIILVEPGGREKQQLPPEPSFLQREYMALCSESPVLSRTFKWHVLV